MADFNPQSLANDYDELGSYAETKASNSEDGSNSQSEELKQFEFSSQGDTGSMRDESQGEVSEASEHNSAAGDEPPALEKPDLTNLEELD